MLRLKLVPEDTHVRFMSARMAAFILSAVLMLSSVGLFLVQGLNFGIDFRGGILIEAGFEKPANIGEVRAATSGLDLGDIAIQEFGAPTEILIRVEQQPGGADAQNAAVEAVRDTLNANIDDEISFRRVEFVGPKISEELTQDGILAVSLAVLAVLIYIWFRFEWQFGVGAVIALVHDVTLTIGFFAITGLEFNLSIVAAILTIVGYSLNDTVVVYDRVRENLRRFRKKELTELFDQSLNETLSRTAMTSVTTLIALFALFFFAPAVVQGFTAAMIWGVIIGTYSSIFIAVPVLLLFKLRPETMFMDDDGAQKV